MRARMILASAAGALLVLVAAASMVAGSATGVVKIVEQSDKYMFTPATLSIHVGDSVTWSNGTDAPHTVTSDSGTELASSTIAAGASFSHSFLSTGTFAYHCTIHTYMTGKVVVLAAGASLPPTDTLPAAGSGPGAVTSSGLPAGLLVLLLAAAAALGATLTARRIRGGHWS